MKRSRKMIINLFLLTGATVIMRFVAMAFNVYISGKIGASGMGLYSLVMSVGTFGVTLALSGVNLASTRMTAAAIGRSSDDEVKGTMKRCIIYALCFGIASAILLFVLAKPISKRILDDERCILLLKMFALGLPFMSLTSALGGYFAAVRRVVKSAAAAFFEQGVKIAVCVYLIGTVAPKGTKYACLAVILGTSISEIASFLLSFILYVSDKRKHYFGASKPQKNLTEKMLGITIPISLSTYFRSELLTVEHLLIPIGLRKFGMSQTQSLASYGILQEMALPVILFPQALIGSMAALLVPELSETQARAENKRIDRIVTVGMKYTLFFSIGVAGVLMFFSSDLGVVIYKNAEAGKYIGILAPLIPIMYVDHTVDGMLKGLGEQLYSMRVNVLDAFLSVILVYFTVPSLGITGYIVTIYVLEILNASLSTVRLFAITDTKVEIIKWIAKPILAIVISSYLGKLVFNSVKIEFISSGIRIVLLFSIMLAEYYFFLRVSGALTKDDIKWMRKSIF